jgi:hypothetical protein
MHLGNDSQKILQQNDGYVTKGGGLKIQWYRGEGLISYRSELP